MHAAVGEGLIHLGHGQRGAVLRSDDRRRVQSKVGTVRVLVTHGFADVANTAEVELACHIGVSGVDRARRRLEHRHLALVVLAHVARRPLLTTGEHGSLTGLGPGFAGPILLAPRHILTQRVAFLQPVGEHDGLERRSHREPLGAAPLAIHGVVHGGGVLRFRRRVERAVLRHRQNLAVRRIERDHRHGEAVLVARRKRVVELLGGDLLLLHVERGDDVEATAQQQVATVEPVRVEGVVLCDDLGDVVTEEGRDVRCRTRRQGTGDVERLLHGRRLVLVEFGLGDHALLVHGAQHGVATTFGGLVVGRTVLERAGGVPP